METRLVIYVAASVIFYLLVIVVFLFFKVFVGIEGLANIKTNFVRCFKGLVHCSKGYVKTKRQRTSFIVTTSHFALCGCLAGSIYGLLSVFADEYIANLSFCVFFGLLIGISLDLIATALFLFANPTVSCQNDRYDDLRKWDESVIHQCYSISMNLLTVDLRSRFVDVLAVLSIGFSIYFFTGWFGYIYHTRYETVVHFLSPAIFATFGMLSSNRYVRSFAILLVVGFASIGGYILLFDGHEYLKRFNWETYRY
jgi:hypothetical protein